MKIIQFITELYPAGAEKVVLNLSRELKRRGHDISVISLQPLPKKNTDIVDDLIKADIPVKSLEVTKFTPWRIFRLVKFIKDWRLETGDWRLNQSEIRNQKSEIEPLVLHSHLIHANLASRIVSLFINRKTLGYKIINTIHIAEKRKSKWWHFFLDKITFRLCNVQTAVSEAAQEYHAKKINISLDRIPVIYNGIIPPKQFNEIEIKNLKKEWGFQNCNKVIGSVGRLDWQKGYDIFLKTLPELSIKIPKEETWGIVILGEGPQRGILQKIIDEIKSNNIKVILPGYRKDAADCISAFDIFIMPSRYEGFGLTLVEAMAHGVPCLCSNADSLPNLIKDYPNGKCNNFEIKNISNKITHYISQEKQKPYFLFTTENMADQYMIYYK
jgi:glycosyltransferase involved in cell wall biosynthesis